MWGITSFRVEFEEVNLWNILQFTTANKTLLSIAISATYTTKIKRCTSHVPHVSRDKIHTTYDITLERKPQQTKLHINYSKLRPDLLVAKCR